MNESEANIEIAGDPVIIDASEIPARPAIYIRMSPEEYRTIATEAKTTGETLPDLLKRVYFSHKKRVAVLMKKEDLHTILGQLGRIGNNINQVARAMNQGICEGFNDDIRGMRQSLDGLMSFMTQKFKYAAVVK